MEQRLAAVAELDDVRGCARQFVETNDTTDAAATFVRLRHGVRLWMVVDVHFPPSRLSIAVQVHVGSGPCRVDQG